MKSARLSSLATDFSVSRRRIWSAPLFQEVVMRFEDLFLARVIVREAIGHELFERDFVSLVSFEDHGAGIGKPHALAHDKRRNPEGGGDRVFAVALVRHGLEGAEFVEGFERLALRVFGKAVGFGETVAS